MNDGEYTSTMNAIALWLALAFLQLMDPLYPQNTVRDGTVVAELGFVAGNVEKLNILSGEEPFASSARSALAEWHLCPRQNCDELVVVYFCRPYLYDASESREELKPVMPQASLPFPKILVQPSYPANALGQGSVILRTEISSKGRVSDVRVIQSIGALTEPSVKAVRMWEFAVPKNEKGERQSFHAYVVLVYRFPLIAK
jgi:TonB family protein